MRGDVMRSFTLIAFLMFFSAILGVLSGGLMMFMLAQQHYSQVGDARQPSAPMTAQNLTGPLQSQVYSIIDMYRDSVVHVRVQRSSQSIFGTQLSEATGSGFVISGEGYLVTNNHVVSDGTNISVVFTNGREVSATLRGADPLNDVAVIKIDPPFELKPVAVGDSDTLSQGEFVLAFGSPFRLQNTVTFGMISGLNRTLPSQSNYNIENVIQTDAAINPGNSGGPLFDMNGEVIGINTAIISQSGGSEGIGFAIPMNTARRIYQEIIDTGRVARPWLGITGVDVTSNLVSMWKLGSDHGVLIIDFIKPSPAKEAGMKETLSTPEKSDFSAGDIITDISGHGIDNNKELLSTLLKFRPGDDVEVTAYRGSEPMEFTVRLGERPQGV